MGCTMADIISDWVKTRYGSGELKNPAWRIKDLAGHIEETLKRKRKPAAPETLESIELAERHLSGFFMTGSGTDDDCGNVSAALDILRDAIKKAKGV